MQPAEREHEVRVVFSGGVGGMDAIVKPTRMYSRRPLAYATRTDLCATRATRRTGLLTLREPIILGGAIMIWKRCGASVQRRATVDAKTDATDVRGRVRE